MHLVTCILRIFKKQGRRGVDQGSTLVGHRRKRDKASEESSKSVTH